MMAVWKENDRVKDFLPLDKSGWSHHYNTKIADEVERSLREKNVSIWSEELVKISTVNSKVLEIGCGSGTSSLWLAMNGRQVTAIDYSESSVALVNELKDRLKVKDLNVILADATKDLPFREREFDIVFQAGLLEHFNRDEQIELLKNWKRYSDIMVSMIPNAASVSYRVGKDIMEKNGTWEYGLEMPKHSMVREFNSAGITDVEEYSIGTEWSLRFLPKNHYLKTLNLII